MVAERPNVLFIICHDISRRFGCYGRDPVRTPHIDALAEQGVLFENHYCQYPLCGPSRANLFTGCCPDTTERFTCGPGFFPAFRRRMAATDYATLPEHFKKAGYFTCSLNQVYHGSDVDAESWSIPQWWPPRPERFEWVPPGQGFALSHWGLADSFALMERRVEALRERGVDPSLETKRWRGPAIERGGEGTIYEDDGVTEKALAILREADSSRPFFIGVGYQTGHLPWCSREPYWNLYDRRSLELPSNNRPPEGAPEIAFGVNEPAQYYTQDAYDLPWSASEEQALELLHGAYASISYFDAQVGRLLDTLDELGLRERTMVVLTTDHGFALGENGKWGKHNLWEESLAVPLIISDPTGRGSPGTRISGLTEHVDVYPTLCDLCGLSKPDFLEGVSAAPLFEHPDQEGKKAVSAQVVRGNVPSVVPGTGRGVRTARYRYNVYRSPAGGVIGRELYDYETDPMQTTNRAGEPEYDQAQRELEELLQSVSGAVQSVEYQAERPAVLSS